MSIRIILVRHGETVQNARHIIQGHLPGILSKKGREQAKKVAEYLKKEKLDRIYVSDLKRTRDTAKAIIKFHPRVPVIYDPRLREQNYGIYQGKASGTMDEAVRKRRIPYHLYTPRGGESIVDVQNRVIQFLHDILSEKGLKTVLLVTHGGPMTRMLMHLERAHEEQYINYRHANTGVTILEFDRKQKHKISVLNSTKHLD